MLSLPEVSMRRLVLLLACNLSCLGPLTGWQEPRRQGVEFFVTDGYGITVKANATIEVIPAGGATPESIADYPRTRTVSLPAGSYSIVTHARGFLPTTR